MKTHSISTIESLRLIGYRVELWPLTERITLQITDSTGISFYMPDTATLEQCLARYGEKIQQFKQATT